MLGRRLMRRFSVLAALLLSLVVSSQALAASWQTPVPLSTPDQGLAGGLVTLGSSVAVAVYAEDDQVYRRLSANSGRTWSGRVQLSDLGTVAIGPAIGGRGNDVDVVWTESDFPESHIRYTRSTNGGRTFGSSVNLTRVDGRARSARVARGPNDRVAVIWHDVDANDVRLRVSTDGGATFGMVRVLGTTFGEAPLPVVGVGKGVIYAAWLLNDVGVRVRRSLDNGRTWGPSVGIANNGVPLGLDLTASGSQAYLAYVAESGSEIWVRYSRTTNKGASWGGVSNLSPASGPDSTLPRISLRRGVVRAIFSRCLDADCTSRAVFYRQSANGTSWTPAEQASEAGPVLTLAGGVGYAGKIIVLYTGYDSVFDPIDLGTVFARRATPDLLLTSGRGTFPRV